MEIKPTDGGLEDVPEHVTNGSTKEIGRAMGKPLRVLVICVVISSVGILFNSLVVLVTCRIRPLRNSTFICLSSLAVADIVFLLASSVIFADIGSRREWCETGIMLFDSVQDSSRLSSAFHLVLLSAIRFYKLGFPFKALVHLTCRRTLLLCGLTWALSAVLATGNVMLIKFYIGHDSKNETFYHYDSIIAYYALPLTMLILFHTLKLHWIRRSRANWGVSDQQSRRMLIMVVLVILVFLMFNLPMALRSGLLIHKTNSHVLGELAAYCILLNSTLNPVLYLAFAPQFRSGLVKMLCCTHRNTEKSEEETVEMSTITK